MESYILYVCLAGATISLPGPVVMLTLNNSVQKGRKKALSGIFGIAPRLFLFLLSLRLVWA